MVPLVRAAPASKPRLTLVIFRPCSQAKPEPRGHLKGHIAACCLSFYVITYMRLRRLFSGSKKSTKSDDGAVLPVAKHNQKKVLGYTVSLPKDKLIAVSKWQCSDIHICGIDVRYVLLQ